MKNIVWMLFVVLAYGCTEETTVDNGRDNQSKIVGSIELKELISSDSYDVTSTKTFMFSDGGISYYVSAQEIEGGELFSSCDTTFVSASDRSVRITDSYGNIRTYQLDTSGFAVSCRMEEGGGTERNYDFTYITDSEGHKFLSEVTEKTDNGEIYSSLRLDYSEEGKVRVEQTVDGLSETYIIEFNKSVAVENTHGLPDLFLSELYPLSMHIVAFYGGFIGDSYRYLCTDMYPASSAELEEHTSYEYSLGDDGELSGCRMVTVSGGEEYVRNISVKFTI